MTASTITNDKQPVNNNKTGILKDKVIICTYPEKEQDELAEILTEQGANVISMPLIETSPLPFQLENEIASYEWLVFTSKNAVQPFAEKYPTIKNKVAVLGEKTAEKLIQHHYQLAFTGSGKSATHFGNEFKNILHQNENVLLVLGNLAPDTLENLLGEKTFVDRVNVYQTKGIQTIDQNLLQQIRDEKYDGMIVTSPSAYHELKKHLPESISSLKIFSIGPTTTATLRDDQIEPLATSQEASYKGLANTVKEYYSKKTIKN
ncbi:MAG TPA: uroporphyrinogen-III synthase [Sunxiuqinia sp.]|nr:uroporphyrinogen-III synthase [Sunxiuqinia sp.]